MKITMKPSIKPSIKQATHPLKSNLSRRALLCVLPLIALAACSINPVAAKGQLAQSVEGAQSVTVSGENGSVEIIRDPAATTMQISAAIRCSGSTEEKAAERVKATKLVATRDASGRVRVGVEFPPRESAVTVVVNGDMSASEDSASIVIRAASLDGVDVTTTNGSIDSGAFSGAAKLSTTNGSIEIKDHAGPVDARSSNGSIVASGVRAPVSASTSNGRITVVLAPDAQGSVDLRSSNGSIVLDLGQAWEGTVTADTSNGKIDLSGGTVAKKDGARTMAVGDAAKAKATLDTSNGRITVRAPKK